MSRKYSNFDIRMKNYEKISDYYLNTDIPIVARIDGKAFHTFTKRLERPYCKSLHDLMVDTTCFLIEMSSALCGYTQSDEISLIFQKPLPTSELFFNGRIAKLDSILASFTTAYFNHNLVDPLKIHVTGFGFFDCRVFNVPNDVEALNYLVWRQRDATRNSIQMAGQAKFSHKQLENKNTNNIQEMLWQQHKINWNDYPEFFKRGSLCKKVTYNKYLSGLHTLSEPTFKDDYGEYVNRTKCVRVSTPVFKIVEHIDINGLMKAVY